MKQSESEAKQSRLRKRYKMKINSKWWLKGLSAVALGLLLLLTGLNVSAQRREQRQERREERQERREERRERRRGNNGDFNWGGSPQLRQTALNAGYNEGIKQGRNDRNRNDRFDFRDESGYQKATKDYSSRLGSKELYQRYYRGGFENGYRDGWNGY